MSFKRFCIVFIALALTFYMGFSCGVFHEKKQVIFVPQQTPEFTIVKASETPLEPEPEPQQAALVYLGNFTAYAYDACYSCCGKTDGITATGTTATAGRTIAVDPAIIPLGSEVIVNGYTYIAEDTGKAIKGNKLDIFMASHEEASQWGARTVEVYIKP